MAYLYNIIGLLFDIVGVLMLFKFGLPPDINPRGHIMISAGVDETEKDKARKFKFLSFLALGFLVTGFLLQILSSILQIVFPINGC